MSCTAFDDKFSYGLYNDLHSVEEANRHVRAEAKLDAFLQDASRLFRAHGMQSRFGISLLHKHYESASDERFVEFPERINDRDSLVTRPHTFDLRWGGAVPVVWKLLDARFCPLEYSNDELAGTLLNRDEVPQPFLEDVRQLIEKSPIGAFVGLSIVNRAFYANASSDSFPIEYSYHDVRASVVVLDPRSLLGESTIETAWSFETLVDKETACAQTCRKGCQSVEGGHKCFHAFHHIPQPS